jgi:ABC-type multidrug transport system fused ATPase/permease subunit
MERDPGLSVFRFFRVLGRSEKKKLLVVAVIQIFLNLLDIAGVAIFGLIGVLAVEGIKSGDRSPILTDILQAINIQNLSLQKQTIVLALIATSILIVRTSLSVYIGRKTLIFLSLRGAIFSQALIEKILDPKYISLRKYTKQDLTFRITTGVDVIFSYVIASSVAMVTDLSLLLLMLVSLFFFDPFTASAVIIFFGTTSLTLYFSLNSRARKLGSLNSELTVYSNEKIFNILNLYRELIVRDRADYYSNEIGNIRRDLSKSSAAINFMPFISKYVIEATVVLGGALIAFVVFATKDSTSAVASLAVFTAAATRIGPSVLRLQQSLLLIGGSKGVASGTLKLFEEIDFTDQTKRKESNAGPESSYENFIPIVAFENVTFNYSDSPEILLDKVSLEFEPGKIIAVTGPSGAGKTTFVDLMLGLLTPISGKVSISNMDPLEAFKIWPGACAYVSQDVPILNGTLAENVCMGYEYTSALDSRILSSISRASLLDFSNSLPFGIHTKILEDGSNLSGGQKRRIGIARALFTNPQLLVLDEPTNGLDVETELEIISVIQSLSISATVILVTHNYSVLKHIDDIMYLEAGKIKTRGNFLQIKEYLDSRNKLSGSN